MFKRFEHISPKTKILFAVILLVLLPGAFLSYYGFQSIDQKAENLRTSYRASLNLVRDNMEREIIRLQENLRNSLIEFPSPITDPEELKAWLRKLQAGNSLLKHPFLINAGGGIVSTLFSLGWKENQRPTPSPIIQGNSFQKAEEAEYIKKDFVEAGSFYRRTLEAARTLSDKAFILSRVGRCYYKEGKYQEGISTYEAILTSKSSSARIGSVSAFAVALFEIADGYKALHHREKSLEALRQLFRQLLDAPWRLDDGSYLYYLKAVRDAIGTDATTSSFNEQELNEREDNLLQQATILTLFKEEGVPVVETELKRALSEVQLQHVSVHDGATKHRLGYFRLPVSFQRAGLVAFGYEIEKHNVLTKVFPQVLRSVDLGPEVTVGITNERDSVLFIQEKLPMSRYLVAENFGEDLAGWKVALFDRSGKTLEERVVGEKRQYVLLLGGVILMMALGIVVTVRAAVHEMEVARIQADFVANVSHELKTPLALIRMFGETLETGIVKDEMKRKEFYSIIRKESERLTHLINNVLDFSKMDAGNKVYNVEEADLVEVVRSTFEAYGFHIRELGFEVESHFPSEPILVSIDKDAVSQALLNLLSNATQYSDERKHICVEVKKDARVAQVSVIDEGVGIPKKEQDKVFEKFYRAATAKTKETRGVGLGLTLVKNIVEAHSGSIEVQSEEGKGSIFTLSLPLSNGV
jgi:signal transduction histidine kinase